MAMTLKQGRGQRHGLYKDTALMFSCRLAAERKAAELRESRRAERQQQRLAPIMSKMDDYKAKEDATMAMFRQMAEERKRNGGF